jgi:uncharacterized protein YuzE
MTEPRHYTVEVQYDADTDDYYIQFTDEMLAQVGWQAGDVLTWTDLGDQQWQLTKSTTAKT